MNSLIPIATVAGIVIAVILLVIFLIKCCWKIAGTNEVLIVSGFGKVKTKTGGGLFVIPVVQKTQRMTLENIQVDFTSRNEIPTQDAIHVLVDAVANMAISQDPARQAVAASKFAGYTTEQIRDIVIPVLEGNIREIISQTQFEDLIRGDKKIFAERIQDNVTPNLADMGIDLTTFNIQNLKPCLPPQHPHPQGIYRTHRARPIPQSQACDKAIHPSRLICQNAHRNTP